MTEQLRHASVVLAGGAGARLGGVDKARLRLGASTLLERVLARVAPGAEQVAVAVPSDRSVAVPSHVAVIHDTVHPPIGPLGGLAAAGIWADGLFGGDGLVLTAPVDTPLFPANFAAAGAPLLTAGVDMVAGAFAEQVYPVCGLWRISTLTGLGRYLQSGPIGASVFAYLETLEWRRVDFGAETRNPFANINTPADLVALSARVSGASASLG